MTWPSGLRQQFQNVKEDQFYLIEEAKPAIQTQVIARRPAREHVLVPAMGQAVTPRPRRESMEDDAHGRNAARPGDIPARGWRSIFRT